MLDGSVAVGSVGSLLGDVLSGDEGEDGGRLESGLPGVLLDGEVVSGVVPDGDVLDGDVLEELLLEELVLPMSELDVSEDMSLELEVPVLPVSEVPAADAERERSQ